MTTKHRLSATVDDDLRRAAELAVRDGRAPNVSAWVNEAMRRQVEHDARMRALDEFIAAYESEHGPITDEDIRKATRGTRARATIVRSGSGEKSVRAARRGR